MIQIQYVNNDSEHKLSVDFDNLDDVFKGLSEIVSEVVSKYNEDGDNADIMLASLLHNMHISTQGGVDMQYEEILS